MMNSLTMYVGPMWSGKSTSLLLELEKRKHMGKKVYVFKPCIDDRYSNENIVSHMGWKFPAFAINDGKEIIKILLNEEDVDKFSDITVAVDEMFMIPNSAEELIWLYKNGADILVSSLDLSSACVPFDEVKALLPWATNVVKCKSICSACKQPNAAYTWRKPGNSDEGILVGGVEKYEPRCRLCHPGVSHSSD